MPLLSAYNLTRQFGDRVLFSGVTFDIGVHDAIGLVGENGCGKTTLLRLLTGETAPDDGVLARSKELRLGYMEQYLGRDADRTLYEETLTVFDPVRELERALDELNARIDAGDHGEETLLEQHALQERFEAAGGLYYRSRAKAALRGLGFSEEALSQPFGTLSGGQKSKAAMAKLLLADTNLLLLDEPTNHLDIASCEWLEEFLRGYPGAVVAVSHDRYFLDAVTSRTLELSGGKLYATNGNYSAHREKREKDREVEQHHFETAMREIRHLEDSIQKLKSFNREKSIRAAESKEKALEKKRETLSAPEREADAIRFDFTVRTTGGNDVLLAEQLSMGFGGRPLFSGVNLHLRRGERVFLLGPNGCGKTTLLKGLRGETPLLRGAVRFGAKVSVGYYDQTQAGLSERATVLEEVQESYPQLTDTERRCALAAFLFKQDDVYKPVSLLSGGERARLLLLKLMLARDNFLLLDEPTNHLDIPSREALEAALDGYDGTLLVVSHDRYFIDRLATRVLQLTPDGCRPFDGNYTAYRRQCEATAAPAEEKPARQTDNKRRREQEATRRRLEAGVRQAEREIAAAEEEVRRLQATLEAEEVVADYAKLMEVTAQWEAENARLEQLMTNWEALQLEVEGIEK